MKEWKLTFGMTPFQVAVFAALKRLSGGHTVTGYPMKNIAQEAGMSVRQFQFVIKELILMRKITFESGQSESGNEPNTYGFPQK